MKLKLFRNQIMKLIKESRMEAVVCLQLLTLFVCLLLVVFLSEKAIAVSSSYGDRELPIYSVETSEKKIALSFDAAWGDEDFQAIMKVLEKHKVKTTFFMTGEWVEKYPDCVKYLVEHGHDLGNHSATHPDMTKLSKTQMTEEIQKVHNAVKKLTGYEMFLFRPPYGAYNNELILTCYEMNYFPVQWNCDSLDWKGYDASRIVKNVCQNKNLGSGAIILCHNGADHTAEALDEMITNLKSQGYELVPISELIIRENFHMDVTGRQIAD